MSMYSKAKLAGHPIHPMLVSYPITFYTATMLAFFIYQFVNPDVFWYRFAYVTTIAGVVTALAAAIPGFIDWAYGVPKVSAAKSRGVLHMSLNVGALLFFAIALGRVWGTWDSAPDTVRTLLILSTTGTVLTGVASYHGWELVATHKVGVSLTPEQERLEPVEKRSREEHETSSPHPRPV